MVGKDLKGLAATPIIRLRAPAFDSCYLMVIVGGRRKPYETSIPWVAPMAVIRRAFSALVKEIFVPLCETFAVFVVKKEKSYAKPSRSISFF